MLYLHFKNLFICFLPTSHQWPDFSAKKCHITLHNTTTYTYTLDNMRYSYLSTGAGLLVCYCTYVFPPQTQTHSMHIIRCTLLCLQQAVRYYKLIGSAAFSAQQQTLIIKTSLHTLTRRGHVGTWLHTALPRQGASWELTVIRCVTAAGHPVEEEIIRERHKEGDEGRVVERESETIAVDHDEEDPRPGRAVRFFPVWDFIMRLSLPLQRWPCSQD